MAEKQIWLKKFKSRITKLKLHKPKIQSEEKIKSKGLPDLITPIHEKIKQIQREEAIRVNKNGHLTDVPRVRSEQMRSNPYR